VVPEGGALSCIPHVFRFTGLRGDLKKKCSNGVTISSRSVVPPHIVRFPSFGRTGGGGAEWRVLVTRDQVTYLNGRRKKTERAFM